jgi:hypothetical protein
MDYNGIDASTGRMSRQWTRITGIAGVLSVVLIVIGIATYANVHVNDSINTVRHTLISSRSQAMISIDCQLLSVLTFLVFLVGVSHIFHRTDSDGAVLALIWGAGGLGLAVITMVWQAAYGAAALVAPYIRPGQLKILVALSNTLDQITPAPIAVCIGAASVVIVRTRVLPRWTGWLGVVVAVLSVISILDIVHVNSPVSVANPIALLLWLVWLLAVSINLFRRQEDREASGATQPVSRVSN